VVVQFETRKAIEASEELLSVPATKRRADNANRITNTSEPRLYWKFGLLRRL